jgi:predicted P-type ATPase
MRSPIKMYIYYFGCLASCGILYVLCILYPDFDVWLKMALCDPEFAEVATIVVDGKHYSGEVEHRVLDGKHMAVTEIKCQRFVAEERYNWALLKVEDIPVGFSYMISPDPNEPNVITREEVEILFGPNKMTLPNVNHCAIILRQILHPFYLFQYFAVVIWILQAYVLYSIIILVITGGAIYMTSSELIYNLKRLHDLAGQQHSVTVLDGNGKQVTISDTNLMPGDKLVVLPGTQLPCDVIVQSGRVTVDESMLTGESVPVTKVPFDKSLLTAFGRAQVDFAKYPGSILFSGTRVLQASGGDAGSGFAIGIVYKTGFRSAKGQLVATLLNPKDEFMGFFSDAITVVIFMFLLATCLFIWTGSNLRENGATWDDVFLKYLDAITIAVPPALTASLSVATSVSISRLRKKDIFVSDTARVNWAGICSAACFDKTGTLTEDRLQFEHAFIPNTLATVLQRQSLVAAAEEGVWSKDTVKVDSEDAAIPRKKTLIDKGNYYLVPRGPSPEDLPRICLELMASCHSLAVVNGKPVGDPLEVELLRASGWALELGNNSKIFALSGPPSDATRHLILRHFEFTADKLRAGTLLRRPGGDHVYVCKGSPEVIMRLCNPESVPSDVNKQLEKLAREGLRVIAMGYRKCSEDERVLMSMEQVDVEKDMHFLGLISMSNGLKPETNATIAALVDAEIHCTMITGDHVQTAIAIAYRCGLIFKTRPLYLIDIDEATDHLSVKDISEPEAEKIQEIITSVPSLINTIHSLVEERSKLIPQIAMSGRGMTALKVEMSQLIPNVVRSTQVFARMKPADKQFIVEEIMKSTEEDIHKLDETVSHKVDTSRHSLVNKMPHGQALISGAKSDEEAGEEMHPSMRDSMIQVMDKLVGDGRGKVHAVFCGDGANDMCALRAATVGVSLCEAETSVAAPITSKMQTPHAVVDVLKEGRCSLITAYVLICFNIMYAMVQLFMVCQMYNFGLRVGDMTYLLQDLFFTLVLSLAISVTPPAKKLETELPPQKFFTRYFCFKLITQLIVFPVFQLIVLEALSRQDFYEKYEPEGDILVDTYTYETSCIAHLGLVQIMLASVVSTVGHPFREPWYTNKYHVCILILQGVFVCIQIFMRENAFMRDFLEIKPLPLEFCWIVVGIIAANIVVSGILAQIAELLREKNTPSSQ